MYNLFVLEKASFKIETDPALEM